MKQHEFTIILGPTGKTIEQLSELVYSITNEGYDTLVGTTGSACENSEREFYIDCLRESESLDLAIQTSIKEFELLGLEVSKVYSEENPLSVKPL